MNLSLLILKCFCCAIQVGVQQIEFRFTDPKKFTNLFIEYPNDLELDMIKDSQLAKYRNTGGYKILVK